MMLNRSISATADYNVYLAITHGNVYVYGTHSILHEAGQIEGDRWKLWKDHEIILTRTESGLSMQVLGEDSFVELPRLSMTLDEFFELDTLKTETISQFLVDFEKPPVWGGDFDRKWKTLRKWSDVYGHIPYSLEWALKFDSVIISNTLFVTLTYTYDEPLGLVFNPTNFHGKLYLIKSDGQIHYEEFPSYEDNDLVMMEPGQCFKYSKDLDVLHRLRFTSKS